MTRCIPSRTTLLLVAEALALGVLRLASDVHFEWFAFFDGGAELAIHGLIARGLRPTLDFGYIYGLLPLAAGDLWYAALGPTPRAFAVAAILLGGATAWGFARLLAAVKAGKVGVAWVMVAMPIGLVSAAPPNLTHAMEPAFLVHALADVAGGNRWRALALATACVFVKPSMAYLLGFGILVLMIVRDRPRSVREAARLLAPAVGAAVGVGGLLMAKYGPEVLVRTLLPISGRAVYRENGFGFLFGSGRLFWLPPRARFAFYVETVAGVWIAANLVLAVAAIRQVWRAIVDRRLGEASLQVAGVSSSRPRSSRDEPGSRRRGPSHPEAEPDVTPGETYKAEDHPAPGGGEVVVLCAILHGLFLALFFGNRWSWVYYFPLLVAGVAAAASRSRGGRGAVAVLTLLALPSSEKALRGPIEAWDSRRASGETAGAWASESVRQEWREVKRLTLGRRPVVLATTDGAAFLDRDFTPPTVAFLVRGHFRQAEIDRKRREVRAASAVVVANPAPGEPWFDLWPEFQPELKGARLAYRTARLRVYLRDVSPQPASRLDRPDRAGL